ncbi:hypothetical protein G7Y79_00004g014770 [Physcia stellaris]|nr:hypothetical protein G7Y79_00004g014770 [Physcia stellaris]
MNEHKMHLCLYKPAEDRTFSRKDKFAKHLRVHGLSLESPQVQRWTRLLPERALGCGFCVRYFDNFEDRFQHVAAHFEQGCTRSSWSRSTVLLSLLTQPFVISEWQSLQGTIIDLATSISWPESSSTDSLQRRLEDGTTDGSNLAIAAYNLSSLCSGEAKPVGSHKDLRIPANPVYAVSNSADHLGSFETGMLQR